MRKKTLLTLLALNVILFNAFSQKKEIKYEKIFYKNVTQENTDVTILIDNAVSTDGETKFKLKLTNKTADIILFKPEECKFTINGTAFPAVEKSKLISPNSSESLTISLKGTGYNEVKNYTFEVGGLYKISTNGAVIEAPEFKLPSSKNEIKFGDFTVTLNKLSKESARTDVKFNCTYNGNNMAVIYPRRISVRMPDGNDYATLQTGGIMQNKNMIVLSKGETESLLATWEKMEGGKAMDMQLVDMFIKWNETFTVAVPEKMEGATLNLEFDEKTSNEKGR